MHYLDLDHTEPCGSCAATVGQPHQDGCSIAQCVPTGQQAIACDQNHDCGQHLWTGHYPGAAEAVEHGLWRVEHRGGKTVTWPDITAVQFGFRWDPTRQRYAPR